MTQAVVRRDRPDHRGDAGGEIEQQRARAREPRVHQDGEVPDAVRDLVRGHCESRHQAEGEAAEEGRGDQHSVERVVEAVPDQHQDARGLLAQVLVPVRRVMVPIAVVTVVVFGRVLILRVSVPPEHQLLDDEEDPEPQHQRQSDVVGARGAGSFDRLGQQRQQRRPKQRPGREAHAVREDARAALFRHPKERDRESGTRNAAASGEQDDPEQQHAGRVSSTRVDSSASAGQRIVTRKRGPKGRRLSQAR